MSLIKWMNHSLRRDERGNVSIIFALSAIPILGIVGLAVDLGRAMNARSQVQAAADAAAIAAIRLATDDSDARVDMAKKVFKANTSHITGVAQEIVPSVALADGSVSVSAIAAINTSFGGLVGVPKLNVGATSSAQVASGKQLELAMMIDLTGSMGETRSGSTKISGLKLAAADLLTILFPNGATTSNNVRVSVVPFADYVNAGTYAASVTGLPGSGGSYANISNLASTRQTSFTGTYSGLTGNSSGSQAGATAPSGTVAGQTSAAGTTYSNSYCSSPTSTTTVAIAQYSGRNVGVYVGPASNYNQYNGAAPAGMLKSSTNVNYDAYYPIYSYGSSGWSYYSLTDSYYVPMPSSSTNLTVQTRSAKVNNVTKTGPIGAYVPVSNNATPPSSIVRASTNGSGGYWQIQSIDSQGNLNYSWVTSGYYLPLYTSLSSTTTVAGCENAVASQPSSKLISCVTEREGSDAYTDASGATSPVGSFNHGATSKSNYSSDGKCWVAGRELPAVIPLTNQKTTLTDFFNSATVGGATPGHIGTAWAWYTLAPDWASVWPSASLPSSYTAKNVMKVAVLMTDGEYNIQYASASSRTQALALCDAMKAKGIQIFTVGFGFSTTSTAADNTVEGKAKDLLTKCSSGTSHYYFPYDGAALRQAFKDIGSQVTSSMVSSTLKLTN